MLQIRQFTAWVSNEETHPGVKAEGESGLGECSGLPSRPPRPPAPASLWPHFATPCGGVRQGFGVSFSFFRAMSSLRSRSLPRAPAGMGSGPGEGDRWREGTPGMDGPPHSPPAPPAHAGPCSPSPRGAWEGWQGAAEERAALQAFRREENHFFALFFPRTASQRVLRAQGFKGAEPWCRQPWVRGRGKVWRGWIRAVELSWASCTGWWLHLHPGLPTEGPTMGLSPGQHPPEV